MMADLPRVFSCLINAWRNLAYLAYTDKYQGYKHKYAYIARHYKVIKIYSPQYFLRVLQPKFSGIAEFFAGGTVFRHETA